MQTIEEKNPFIHETAVVDNDCKIGNGTRIWHFSHIMSGSRIGQNCNIGQNVVISPDVIIGNNVKIQNNVSIYSGVECEDDVFIGPSCVFTNIRNPRSEISRRNQYLSTKIAKGATLGANATILCGITIGEYAFIGAGAVVTRSVKAFELLHGNPARHKGWMSRAGHPLKFDPNGIAFCTETGECYQLDSSEVKLVKTNP